MGARSKPKELKNQLRAGITRSPLWGRDQNRIWPNPFSRPSLPDHPCGGEIKTSRERRVSNQRHYQITPVGARSKQDKGAEAHPLLITRSPLWGRDQNRGEYSARLKSALPDHPCGGEIKTASDADLHFTKDYQITPVGARSKRDTLSSGSVYFSSSYPKP